MLIPLSFLYWVRISFNIRRLTNLTNGDLKYRPAVNQVELSWFNPQPALLAWAKKNDILLEAYSPLGSSSQVRKGLEVPEVKEVAAELGIAPAQVVLSWLHQRGVVVLPKSVNEARIQENFESACFNLFFFTPFSCVFVIRLTDIAFL